MVEVRQSIVRAFGVDHPYLTTVLLGPWVNPIAGHLLLLGVIAYDNGSAEGIPVPAGWTAVAPIERPTGTGTDTQWATRLFHRTSDGTETIFDPSTGADNSVVVLAELDRAGTFLAGLTGHRTFGPSINSLQGDRAADGYAALDLSADAGAEVALIGWWGQTGETGIWDHPWGGTIDQGLPGREVAHPSDVNIGSAMVFYPIDAVVSDYRLTGSLYGNFNFPLWAMAAFRTSDVSPPEPGIDHGVYDPDDTFLGDLPSAFDVKVRIELDGTGSGSFKVRRDAADATAEVLTPGNYVRVTVPQIDPGPIFGFFLEGAPAPETPTIRLVSTDESGGELATFGGRGGLAYWERAIWLAESFLINWWPPFIEAAHGVPSSTDIGAISFAAGTYSRYTVSGGHASSPIGFTTGGFSAYYDSRRPYTRTGLGPITLVQLHGGSHDNWYVHPFGPGVTDYKRTAHYRFGNSVLMESIDDGDKPGQILYAMYQESQAAGRPIHPVPLLTVDFDDTNDSDGNPWTVTDALKAISTELGDDYLSTIGKLVNTGAVDVYMDPDLGMHAYNQYGRDLHETVRFAKGLNIADVLDRVYTDQPTGTFAEVQGQSDGTIARVIVAGSPPREISVRGDSDDLAVLESLGEAELALRQLHSDTVAFNVATPIIGREDPDNGMYLPGPPGSAHGDYWVGDLVTLHTGSGEHDFDEQVVRIAAITLQLSDSGDLRVTVEVISGFGGIPTLGSPSSSGPTAGGAGQPQTISDLYQLLSERDQPTGYPGLDANGHVFLAELGGLTWKNSVRVAATANVTLATLDAGDTLDGVTLAEGDEVLLPVQTDPSENGIWVIQASGETPTRRQDFDDSSEIVGAIVPVREGTANERTLWLVTNTTPPVIDTDDITIVQMVPDIDVSALNAAVFGYLAHGNTGASDAFDASAAGWHSATLDSATVTATFAGASAGSVASMILELAQDGTGGRAIDLPASVVNGTHLEASLNAAAGSTTYYVFFSHDGGINWIGFVLGGGGASPSDTAAWIPLSDGAGGVIYDAGTGQIIVAFTTI